MQAAGLTTDSTFARQTHPLQAGCGLSLIFAAGQRPTADDIERLLASESMSGQRARVVHRGEDGWLELLAGGLAFDLTGLAPVASNPIPAADHCFGVSPSSVGAPCEAITLLPGEAVAGGRAMLPLVRAMIGIAAGIALPLPVKATCWHPAASWMEPGYFTQIAVNWLSGGGFPAMGLTALETGDDGSVESNGLSFFVGQEVRVEPSAGTPPAEVARLAVRVIDHVVRHGRLQALCELHGGSGEIILAEPSHDGRLIRVWRSS